AMFRIMVTHAKKHPSLIPLFLIIGSGGVGAALYVMRLAMFNPDVCWDKKNNPEPWNKLAPNDQYKVKQKQQIFRKHDTKSIAYCFRTLGYIRK
uniref:Cytochrome c oxidase subunit NDUFA4 n=1 Tax=Anser cygnoides TaxID=8845 RepID=A0A8B9DI09_ANSCY